MKIKWRIARSGQGGRTPAKHKACRDCGEELTKFRFEINDHVTTGAEIASRTRVCPQCVLMAYLNSVTFWEWVRRFFKPKYKRNEIIEEGGATSEIK
ncbi:hypothetical protein KAR91_87720 [Candidatus Pacearchaeota archaeon]|nr:hypothetical protein [Candidatus Pacearchaeota archaeon]